MKPIGGPSTFQVSWYPESPWWAKITGLAFYAAYSGKRGGDGMFRHYRLGTRRDTVDNYSPILSVASRKYTGDDKQKTDV